VPESVGKFTIAVDGWGWDDLNPVQMQGVTFLQDYINLFLLMRDEEHNIVSGLATDWELNDDGFRFTLHPNATWQDGSPITAEDVKWNYEASRGDYSPEFTGHLSANRFKEQIGEIEVISDKEVMINTVSPVPDFVAFYSGSGYHQVHMGNSAYLQEVGVDEFEKNPSGGGPYTVSLWRPSERIELERWDDFWGDTPWYHAPQHESLEIILSTDAAARYGLLRSGQVDAVVNIPYVVARDIPRSEDFERRGINPDQGDQWTQTIRSTGNYNIDFVNLMSDSLEPPSADDVKPFDDIRVREAFELAIDKVSITENAHHGFTTPMGGLWFTGSFGFQSDIPVSPYDPDRAKQLLEAAGYGDGFEVEVYYGPFVNSPGQRDWLEAAASFLKDVNIDLKIFEVPTAEFYSRCCFGAPDDLERPYRPLIVQTWGRQEHAGVIANYGYHRTGSYICCWDETTEAFWEQANSTTESDVQLEALSGIENHVLENRWVIPMAEVAVVQGYTDRVLAHPTPPFASSFEQLWRVVLRD
jgi:ABC-type transport system substrate-binding protein